ncbi:tRNA/tmRNA/rRNA uracil-C5-methylase (TrmA/RlmC/RlmD family) [Cryobacterium mesophilum]|uniref:Class I SAM-dependent RNA methyltransferase n=1 Tax=Terrimesophilobacter mesophilus TaxID=433647 RepID=A0A4R8V9T3_9MICO|nr:TRAM domain-containing protein [Terrimesophilobacter mesophilus]MBB5632698.1 tRNA/tmRNA/rRNA uracil-C5-methylase (TrmA/RlmC/RlmD family) [Terrimesophilobacter mesophilus]TFB79503.1 class I SAM-dependent RNA methyltransferase [Terrimesophilobacter mesophilus]
MGENLGQLVELEISNVAHGGAMVARHEGRVVFVSDAIPGETVRAVITDDAKSAFWRADAVEILDASPHRQDHVWSAASIARAPLERVGGAEFGHIAIEHQRELKRRVLADAVSRMAGVDSPVVVEPVPGAVDGTGWRTRVRLHVADDGTVGGFAARSHRVIPVTDLPLATPAIAAAAPLGRRARHNAGGHIDIVAPSRGDTLVLDGNQGDSITEVVGDREFHLAAGGFWQVHTHAAATLTGAVQEAIDADLFDPLAENLDLYGGVGLLAAAVGDRFGPETRITTVESDARATEFATANLAEWAAAGAVTARADRFLARATADGRRLDGATVILDPPRSGAGKGVVGQLAALHPTQIVYVACDPVALARDLALFASSGYRLNPNQDDTTGAGGIRAFDLFPNTHHVEAVARLVRE